MPVSKRPAPDWAAFGRKGGKARARRLSPRERGEAARQAALAKHEHTPQHELSEAMRRAVLERWRRYRAAKKKSKP